MAHVFLAGILFLFSVKYSGNLIVLFGLPITLVISIHIYVAIVDKSMSKSEHLGYALVHIPFSMILSFLALLLFIPKDNEQVEVDLHRHSKALFHCVDKSKAVCLNNLYQRTSSQQTIQKGASNIEN
jgi:hypothetical protein